MYWYVKLVLWLILATVVLLVGRCGYRRVVAPRLARSEREPQEAVPREAVPGETRPGVDRASGLRPAPLSPEVARLLNGAEAQLERDNPLGARQLARRVLHSGGVERFDSTWWRAAEIVSQVNTLLISSDLPAPEKIRYEVQSGDALERIARRFGTTVESIQRMNNISPERSRIYPGMILHVYSGDWSILVSKEHFALVLYDGDQLFKVYRVGIGRQDRTPVGRFVIQNKLREPVWTPPGRHIPFGDPDNVLGTRWLGLMPIGDTDPTLTAYGIHGTWEPDTIGTAASQGCVRMLNSEVEELYAVLPHPRYSPAGLRENPSRGIMVTIEE